MGYNVAVLPPITTVTYSNIIHNIECVMVSSALCVQLRYMAQRSILWAAQIITYFISSHPVKTHQLSSGQS